MFIAITESMMFRPWRFWIPSLMMINQSSTGLKMPGISSLVWTAPSTSTHSISTETTESKDKIFSKEWKWKLFYHFSILRSESLAIADLGTAIYDALDYSLDNDEQRTLSSSLENLIDKMTSADDDADDEGIDDDEDSVIRQSGQCSMVLDLCRHHLASQSEAECHYKAVCR